MGITIESCGCKRKVRTAEKIVRVDREQRRRALLYA
jgi:hypothetical protein